VGELLTMSEKELRRLEVLGGLEKGLIKPEEAAAQLSLSSRQVRGLLARLKGEGPKGPISKKRGKKGNHRHQEEFKEKILSVVKTYYSDFGPTFAAEKLSEEHDLKVGVETLRQWMKESGIWIARKAKEPILHPTRARRKKFGEMIQIDGSLHAWFEGRAEPCALIVFIDDAMSRLTALQFREREDLEGYFQTLEMHIKEYGLPRALYSDRFSVFKVNHGARAEERRTQFKRALDELSIELICARSPQAKGRVERANGTLQDRLVKELRLRGISTMEEANRYLPEFVKAYNRKFEKSPMDATNAHRKPREGLIVSQILCRKETRKLTKDLTFQYASTIYQTLGIEEPRRAVGKEVEISSRGVTIRVTLNGKEIRYRRCDELVEEVPVLDRKELLTWKVRGDGAPSKDHPWRGQRRSVGLSL